MMFLLSLLVFLSIQVVMTLATILAVVLAAAWVTKSDLEFKIGSDDATPDNVFSFRLVKRNGNGD